MMNMAAELTAHHQLTQVKQLLERGILTRPCSVTVHTSIAPHCELSKE